MSGSWRVDIIVMVLYQITLIFSAQLIFVIFLDYMPTTYCTDDNFCYKLNGKCLTDYDHNAENLCSTNMTENRTDCIEYHKTLYFRSARFEYQQYCEGMKIVPLSTMTFIGMLLGNVVLGVLADKLGRRTIYFVSLIFGIPCVVFSAAIKNVYFFYLFRLLIGFSVSGTLTVGWTYATEMISPNKRLRILALANWPNARMIQVAVAYISHEWTTTAYICASIACLALPILWYLPESPIWLEQNGKYKEVSRARKRLGKIGKRDVDDQSNYELVEFEKATPKRVFMNKKLRTNFLMIVFMYFYVGLAVYITDLNGADMTKNLYVGQFLSGLVLSIAQFIIGMTEPYLTRLGRRVLFLASQLIAIICYIIIIVCLYFNMKGTFPYLAAYTLAYASQSLCLEAAYLSLVELMPTDVRATVGSISNIGMKLGSTLASLTTGLKYIYEPSLFFINLIVCSIGMVLVFFKLEESREADMKMVGQIAVSKIFALDEGLTPGTYDNESSSKSPTFSTQESTASVNRSSEPVELLLSAEQLKINERNQLKVDTPVEINEKTSPISVRNSVDEKTKRNKTGRTVKFGEKTTGCETEKGEFVEKETAESVNDSPTNTTQETIKTVKKTRENEVTGKTNINWEPPNKKGTGSSLARSQPSQRPSRNNSSSYDNSSSVENESL